jgi:hypothetical protein
MIKKRNNKLWYQLNGLLRRSIVTNQFGLFNKHVTINEYPKSGGTWLTNMVSEILDYNYPRDRLPNLSKCMMHGHYVNVNSINNQIIMYRDGRDVMVSQYYHFLVPWDNGKNKYDVSFYRKKFQFDDYMDIETNMSKFIEMTSDKDIYKFSWGEFVDRWKPNEYIAYTKYELLKMNPFLELVNICNALKIKVEEEKIHKIIKKYDFKSLKKEKKSSGGFLRKGIVGDWKNIFSKEARNTFSSLYGKQLISLGYEKDDNWI